MLLQYAAFLYLFCPRLVHAQGPYRDGAFVYPPNLVDDTNQSKFPHWNVGTEITVRWNTTYNRSNLFFSQFSDDGKSQLISAYTDKKQASWKVETSTAYPNLSIPFHFHVVNPEGTPQDQTGGGFWSAGFFIRIDGVSNSAGTTSSPSATPTTAAGISGLSSVSQSSTSLHSTISSFNTSVDSNPKPSNPPSGSNFSGGAIAGTVVGGLAALLIISALIYWMIKRKIDSHAMKLQQLYQQNSGYYSQPPHETGNMHYMPILVEAPTEKLAAEAGSIPIPPPPPVEIGSKDGS